MPLPSIPDKSLLLKQAKEKLKNTKLLIVGGNKSWHIKLKAIFSNWKYLDPNLPTGFDTTTLSSFDAIVFYTGILSHSTYNKLMGEIRSQRLPHCYISKTSINQLTLELYNELLENKIVKE